MRQTCLVSLVVVGVMVDRFLDHSWADVVVVAPIATHVLQTVRTVVCEYRLITLMRPATYTAVVNIMQFKCPVTCT